VNGVARGSIYDEPNDVTLHLGITAPTTAPTVAAAAGGSAYEGTYYCAYRWKDANGVYSSLSPLAEVSATANQKFSWNTVPISSEAPIAGGSTTRCTKVELYRSTVDQSTTLYLVTELDNTGTPTYTTDTLTDDALMAKAALPIYYDNGGLYARRQAPPPEDMGIVCPYQDRYFYTAYKGTSDASRRNLLLYSEPDEPESVPPDQNALVVSDDTDDNDQISGLAPMGSVMLVLKERHVYRFSFVSDPRFDGSCRLLCSRGALNNRCWTVLDDTLYALDELGPWCLAGEGPKDLSGAIRDYFRDEKLNWLNASNFFVSSEAHQRVVRFHVSLSSDTAGVYPKRALCYSAESGQWWTETYAFNLGATCKTASAAGRLRTLIGTEGGYILFLDDGRADLSTAGSESQGVDWTYKSGMIPIPVSATGVRDHNFVITFQPTTGDETFTVKFYFDHETAPQTFYPMSEGPVSVSGQTSSVTVNMKRARSMLSGEVGYARIPVKFRADHRAISHRFITVELSGKQLAEEHVIHSIGWDNEGQG